MFFFKSKSKQPKLDDLEVTVQPAVSDEGAQKVEEAAGMRIRTCIRAGRNCQPQLS